MVSFCSTSERNRGHMIADFLPTGVRNAVARNNMRAMRKGDLAFFYHSNCAVPGIAGVMRIVEEHTVDDSAFDPNHPYYDPKSDREKPKWELVKVEFVKKLENLITLRELRSLCIPGSVLEDMVMLKQSRLSVSPVTAAQWQFILDLAGEKPSLGHPTPQDGYESDIDSEGRDDDDDKGDGVNGAAETSPANGTKDDFSLNILTGPKDEEQNAAKDVDEQEVTNGTTANGVAPELTSETLKDTDAA
jgi:predicted RNA-binding protein with PUA-like domain